ncbi:MAG: epoxide hydrolase N-terminal domain-containing protein, partial [Chloroflexi bacterium]|nr:epoxide hydrolase N-terminal domain-containing protein [Chloroflexota bacterium]
MNKVQPFKINVPQNVLDDLQKRLKRTRWTDEVEGTGWDYGTNLSYMKELVAYWQHQYDWRKQEAALNKVAQFKAEVDDKEIHFIHERGKGPNPTPLILF